MVNFRTSGGTVGRLWTSSVAIGRQHGFDIQVFGETGGLRWASEQPNQLIYTPVGGRTQIIEKGEGGLHEDAQRLSRVSIAHPEGFPLAVANIYCDLADAIRGASIKLPGNLLMQAVRDGQGVAVGVKDFVSEDLEAGRLVELFTGSEGRGYHIVTRSGVQRAQARRFITWLRRHKNAQDTMTQL